MRYVLNGVHVIESLAYTVNFDIFLFEIVCVIGPQWLISWGIIESQCLNYIINYFAYYLNSGTLFSRTTGKVKIY